MNNKKLPVAAIFFEALSLPQKHYRNLLKVGFPLIISCGLLVVINNISPNSEKPDPFTALNIGVAVVTAVVLCVPLVMAIIGCHRLFILEPNAVSSAKLFHWTGNEIKYAGWSILLSLCAIVIAMPVAYLLPLSTLIGSNVGKSLSLALWSFLQIPIYYVVARCSLVLPSAAIDRHGRSLPWSWTLSDGNGWRLTFLIVGLPFMLDTLVGLLPRNDSIFYDVFLAALWLIVGVIQVGLLSLSYAFLVSEDELAL